MTTKLLFYPGCSLQRTARPYLDSVLVHHIATTALSRLHDTRLQLIGTHA